MPTTLVEEYRLKTTWNDWDRATPDLIDPLLADMFGAGEDEAFIATREQAKEILTWGEMTMGNLGLMLSSFYDGFEACLEKHLRQCP